MAPQTPRNPSAASSHGRFGPIFQTVPVKWRGTTLDVARCTFPSQELREISSRAIRASAESYCVRLLRLETLDTELPEELHRLELLTTDLKTRIRAAAAARKELLDDLNAHALSTGALDHHSFEMVVEELGEVTQAAEDFANEFYVAADQIAQLKRLRDVHFRSALATSLRKLNTSFLRQGAENHILRERVAALEAERDIAWTQAEHVAQEFDDLSAKLEQGTTSTPSIASNSRRASVAAVRKSSIRVSKSGLRQSTLSKTTPRASKHSSGIESTMQLPEGIPPIPPLPEVQDFESTIGQLSCHRLPFLQTNPPGRVTPGRFNPF